MRRALAGLTGALPLLAVFPAGPAFAETVSSVIQATNEPGHKDHLQIDFSGDTKVKTVQAHLVPRRHTGAPAIDVTDFTFAAPVGQFQRATATVRPDVLDTYTVEVTATDAEGNTLPMGQGVFAFFWGVQPQYDLTLDTTWNRSGYWRLHVLPDRYNDEAISRAAKLWRWNTRIEHFKVSPGQVRRNHYVTASGTLTRAVSMTKRTAYTGRTVEVIFQFKGKKTWYHLAWAKTDKHGRFSKKVKAYGSGYYAVIFRGGSDTFADWTTSKNYVRAYAVPADDAITPSRPGVPKVATTHP